MRTRDTSSSCALFVPQRAPNGRLTHEQFFKTLIGIVGIALIIGLMLVLSKLPVYAIAGMVAGCLAPGFIRLFRLMLIKKGKYPEIKARILSSQGVYVQERKDIWETEREQQSPGYSGMSSTTGETTLDGHNGNIEYTVDGKTYQCYKKLNDAAKWNNGTITAYYNPKNPKKMYVESYLHDVWIPFVVGGIGAAFIIVLYWFAVIL